MSSTALILLLFGMMLVMIFIGVPVAFSVGISALTALMIEGIPLSQLITKMFGGVDSFTVLAIPFYILVGSGMNNGQACKVCGQPGRACPRRPGPCKCTGKHVFCRDLRKFDGRFGVHWRNACTVNGAGRL